jgi:hypothetical protein
MSQFLGGIMKRFFFAAAFSLALLFALPSPAQAPNLSDV